MITCTARSGFFAAILVIACLSFAHDSRAAVTDDPVLLMGILDQFEWRDTSGDNTLSLRAFVGKMLENLDWRRRSLHFGRPRFRISQNGAGVVS